MDTVSANCWQELTTACPAFTHVVSTAHEIESLVDLWRAFAGYMLDQLASKNLTEFEAGFGAAASLLESPEVRRAAMPSLFGDFTRRAIAAGVDRTRFVAWLGPQALLDAPEGRLRGRILYFDDAKGRGKLLASDASVVFVHFSAINGDGVRSVAGGQLVEFERIAMPKYEYGARDVTKLPE